MSTLATAYPWQMKIENYRHFARELQLIRLFYAWMRAEQPFTGQSGARDMLKVLRRCGCTQG